MKDGYVHYLQALTLALLIPCLYGCGSGGDNSASLSSFAFGSGDATVSLLSSGDDPGAPPAQDSFSSTSAITSTQLATIHNPEPATMLLLGSGIVAMRLTRNRKNSPPRGHKM